MTTQAGTPEVEEGASNPVVLNEWVRRFEASAQISVTDRDSGSPPGSPVDGQTVIVGGTPSGAFVDFTAGNLAVYNSTAADWYEITPQENWVARIEDEGVKVRRVGSSWVGYDEPWDEFDDLAAANGITASSTQSQGQEPLVKSVNFVETVGTQDDVVTMPPCKLGRRVTIFNMGAQRLQVFPASGDSFDGGSVDAATTVATAQERTYIGRDGTDWRRLQLP